MSDHTAVRRDGRIERMAPREKVCDRPATALWHRFNRLVEPRCAFCSATRVVYAEGCTVSADRLRATGVVFKQISYQVKGV